MKIINKITNGILLIVIGIMHSHLAFSPDGLGNQFLKFSNTLKLIEEYESCNLY
jgi:hypothetical protein